MKTNRTIGKFFLFFFFCFVYVYGEARNSQIILTDSSRISLLTCSSGDELYATFGHSAIRVRDPQLNFDIVFNYGTFDFWDPKFYPNFVRGRLNYILSISSYREFIKGYIDEKRWVWEQKLNIDPVERQLLLDSLFINYRPENRFYRYDFFNDNCATRIRDIFVKKIPWEITFDFSSFEKDQSFRQLLMPNLTYRPWTKLGINLLLGLPADRKALPWEYMYLPEHLKAAFQHSSISPNSAKQPLTQPVNLLLEGNKPSDKISWISPLLIFVLILTLAIFISILDFRKGIKSLWFDRIILILAGIFGALFTFLWLGTAHRSMVWNLNLLWANPLHLIIIFFLSIKKIRKWVQIYLKINLAILLVLLISWTFLPQSLPWVIYPFILAIFIRLCIITQFPQWVIQTLTSRSLITF